MTDHPAIQKLAPEDLRLNTDIFLMDECWLEPYKAMLGLAMNGVEYQNIGEVSYASARYIDEFNVGIVWYANIFNRWHEIDIELPRSEIIECVECYELDERKTRIFIRSPWLSNIHLRKYSTFCMIDAIGVKRLLSNSQLSRDKLVGIRSEIDILANMYPGSAFISFADTVLVKTDWTVGLFRSNVRYSYEPELVLQIADKVNEIYCNILGVNTYSVIAQGVNEFFDDQIIHISGSRNHISLNSLGGPFAKIMEIDATVRENLKNKIHQGSDYYLDHQFNHSLSYKREIAKCDFPNYNYKTKFLHSPGNYYCHSRDGLKSALDFDKRLLEAP